MCDIDYETSDTENEMNDAEYEMASRLEESIVCGEIEELRELVQEEGFNINVKLQDMHHCDGGNAIDLVVRSTNNVERLRLLVEHGASLEFRDSNGRTPLASLFYDQYFDASKEDDTECFEYLLQQGANPHARDHDGNTPLHSACIRDCARSRAMARILLEHGANVNAVNDQGSTPLHEVTGAQYPNCHLIKLLMEHGANVNLCNKDGNTAMVLAASHRRNSYRNYGLTATFLLAKQCLPALCVGQQPGPTSQPMEAKKRKRMAQDESRPSKKTAGTYLQK